MQITIGLMDTISSRAAKAAGVAILAGVIGAGPATFAAQMTGPPRRGSDQTQIPPPEPQPTPPIITGKQKQEFLKSNFAAMKKHADKLQKMANSLQKMIDQSNENVLSLDVIRKADAIQKLAKKIKSEAKGI